MHPGRQSIGMLVALIALLAAACAAQVQAQGEVGYIDGQVVDIPGRRPPDSQQRIDRPVAGSQVKLSNAADGRVVDTTTSDAKGEFHFAVAPGDYSLSTDRDQRRVHVDTNQRTWVRLGTPGNM